MQEAARGAGNDGLEVYLDWLLWKRLWWPGPRVTDVDGTEEHLRVELGGSWLISELGCSLAGILLPD